MLKSKVETEKCYVRGFSFQVESSWIVVGRWLWVKCLCELVALSLDPGACVCNSALNGKIRHSAGL